jgi:hypothetical protein
MDLKLQPIPKALYTFLNKKWHFDYIVNEIVVLKTMNFGYSLTFLSLDKGLIERVGPSGFTTSIYTSSANLVAYYSGLLYHTAFAFIIASGIFLSFFAFGVLGVPYAVSFSFVTLILSYIILLIFDPYKNN